MNAAGPINVLMFYDAEGWAWWYKTHHVKNYVSEGVNVHILKLGTPFNPEDFDLVVTFNPNLSPIRFVPPHKLVAGASCPIFLEKLLKMLESKQCLAGFVNSLEMYTNSGKLQEQVYCCQNGVDTDLFTPTGNPVVPLTACWIGNSSSIGNKGLDLIKDACREAEIPLNFIDRNAGKDVSGILSHREIRDQVYYSSSVYICASEFEATPNPALEALASGLPVISTRVGNMPELIKDGYNGFLVERSVAAIAGAIEKMKQMDPDVLSRNARASIENGWSWKQQAEKYDTMFRELVQKQQSVRLSDSLPLPADYPAAMFRLAKLFREHKDFKNARRRFEQALQMEGLPDELRWQACYYLAEIFEAEQEPDWISYLQKALEVLRRKDELSAADEYRIASFHKRLGGSAEARRWFKRVLENVSAESGLIGGSYFHLGEISLQENRRVQAKECFEKCLELIPDHQKSARLLEGL